MKYDQLAAFQRHVENTSKNTYPPIYLILSSDENLAGWVMQWMTQFFVGFDKGTTLNDLIPSLFSKEVLLQLKWEALPEDLTPLIKFIDHTPNGMHVLLSLPKLETTNPFYKKVEKAGVVLQLGSIKPWEKESFFIDFLLKKAQKERVVLAFDAAKAIVARSGNDPFAIESSFEKLSLWKCEEKKITLQDVNTLGPFDEEETLFHLTDALLSKKSHSQEIAARLLTQGTSPLVILKTFRNQCALLYDLKVSPETTIGRHAYLKGNILDQKMTQSKIHTLNEIKQLILKADELERFYKNSSLTDEIFLEFLLSSLS